jgi:outer membrane protein assembly factor BamB
MTDLGAVVSPAPDRLCRAEVRVESPAGTWTVRLASPIFDEPSGMLWDTHGMLVVTYGFTLYALDARTGVLRWHHASRTPMLAVLGSSRLDHVIAQSELETTALDKDGDVRWRVAQRDVVAEARLVGGRLVLSSFGGLLSTLDPATGRAFDR